MTDSRPPRDIAALQELLRDPSEQLPRRLQQCADLVLEKQDRIAVSTLAELIEGTEIQLSAFVRFCKHFGFSGFSEMQRLFRNAHDSRLLDYNERLKQLVVNDGDHKARIWTDFLEAGRVSTEGMLKTVPLESLSEAAKLIQRANVVHVAGTNRAFAVASHFAYTLSQLEIPVAQHLALGHTTLMGTMKKGDVLVAVTYAPYSPKTIELAEFARESGLSVVAITDMAGRGLADLADISLHVPERSVGGFRGLSASITLATVLAIFAGQEKNV